MSVICAIAAIATVLGLGAAAWATLMSKTYDGPQALSVLADRRKYRSL